MKPQLEALDDWFRHAETIGQTRLSNFLLTGSVILIACATVMNLDDERLGSVLAIALALLGLALSVLWMVLGWRQVKFHDYVQWVADRVLEGLPAGQRELQAFYWVRRLQRNQLDDTDPPNCRLNSIEVLFSSRFFLWFVPLLFAVAYLAMSVGAAWKLVL